jgi:D-tyrosyl-tRNA(Tyr) deacylase
LRALVQRALEGSVFVKEDNYLSEINKGMVVLLGVKNDDEIQDVIFTADKCCNLRIFEDFSGKMNLSLKDVDGQMLIISQFTLYGETRKGNRPNFTLAARPLLAKELYEAFIKRVRENIGADKVSTGIFGAMMEVKIINDGPVTVMVESPGNA